MNNINELTWYFWWTMHPVKLKTKVFGGSLNPGKRI
jgi:hypothetical protein